MGIDEFNRRMIEIEVGRDDVPHIPWIKAKLSDLVQRGLGHLQMRATHGAKRPAQ